MWLMTMRVKGRVMEDDGCFPGRPIGTSLFLLYQSVWGHLSGCTKPYWPTDFFTFHPAALVLCNRSLNAIHARRQVFHTGVWHSRISEPPRFPLVEAALVKSVKQSQIFGQLQGKTAYFPKSDRVFTYVTLAYLKVGPHAQPRKPMPRCCNKQLAQWKDKATGRYSRRVKARTAAFLSSQKHNSRIKVCSYFCSHLFTLSTVRQTVSRENILYSPCKQINKNALKILRQIAISCLKPIQYLTSQQLHILFIALQLLWGKRVQKKASILKMIRFLKCSFYFN